MEKFHMFDDRIYQMTNGVKAADRIIYTVMLNEQKFYHDKGQYYTPSYAHLGQYAGEGANKQVISSQADSLIKISRIWADFFPANTSNQPI